MTRIFGQKSAIEELRQRNTAWRIMSGCTVYIKGNYWICVVSSQSSGTCSLFAILVARAVHYFGGKVSSYCNLVKPRALRAYRNIKGYYTGGLLCSSSLF